MTSDTQNHQVLRGFLEDIHRQVESTQTHVSSMEGQLLDIKSQIDLTFGTIDTALKQLATHEQNAEQLQEHVAVTLGEMFEQMTRIVNGVRDQMLHSGNDSQDGGPNAPQQAVAAMPIESPETAPAETTSTEMATEEIEIAENSPIAEEVSGPDTEIAENEIHEIAETDMTVNSESKPAESNLCPEVEKRASDSLDEMISTIKNMNEPTQTAIEPPTSPPPETDKPQGPGSSESLSVLLEKARSASGETDASETPDEEEEDMETLTDLIQNTSGSIVAQ